MSIQASVPPPAAPRGFQGKGGPRGKYAQNLKKYGTPLPILLSSSPLHSSYKDEGGHVVDPAQATSTSLLSSFVTILNPAKQVEVPTVIGTLDPQTQSVWVTDPEGMQILFNRGFFGKGTLSRSEPSWRQRRIELVRGGDALAAELIRDKRRQERKQFKIDRAAAMLEAAKTAEKVLVTGEVPEDAIITDGQGNAVPLVKEEEEAAELPAGTKLTASTFLVRPSRPDANRNRGKKTFKRRPPQATVPVADGTAASSAAAVTTPALAPVPTSAPTSAPATSAPQLTPPPPEEASDDEASLLVAEKEHLQLSFEEAWFLSTAIGVLKIRVDNEFLPSSAVLSALRTPTPSPSPSISSPHRTPLYPSDPLLLSYAAYHHYRSLGWCVRHGIKFCVDWLLYRKGPVFSHSAFSILLVPVFMDEGDAASSPYRDSEWHQERMSWKWVNTVTRVNNLVMKTVILAYVTIPALSSFPSRLRLGDGLNPNIDMRTLMSYYTVREVSLTRFSAARRRD